MFRDLAFVRQRELIPYHLEHQITQLWLDKREARGDRETITHTRLTYDACKREDRTVEVVGNRA